MRIPLYMYVYMHIHIHIYVLYRQREMDGVMHFPRLRAPALPFHDAGWHPSPVRAGIIGHLLSDNVPQPPAKAQSKPKGA